MNQVIAMHGWYSDSTFWKNWQQDFQLHGWIWQNIERGYGYIEVSEPSWKQVNNSSNKIKRVLFCHSLGIHLVSPEILYETTHLILLNSFSRFIPKGIENRAIKIALDGMQRNLGTENENKMLLKFALKAKKNLNSQIILGKERFQSGVSHEGRQRLKADLELLINTRKLPSSLNKHSTVLVINAADDAIICSSSRISLIEDLQKYLYKKPIHWEIKDQGHFMNNLTDLISEISAWLKSN